VTRTSSEYTSIFTDVVTMTSKATEPDSSGTPELTWLSPSVTQYPSTFTMWSIDSSALDASVAIMPSPTPFCLFG
jgi:hypothetical protein